MREKLKTLLDEAVAELDGITPGVPRENEILLNLVIRAYNAGLHRAAETVMGVKKGGYTTLATEIVQLKEKEQ